MPKPCLPVAQYTHCPKGHQATEYKPGDFLLISDGTVTAKLIQFGQKLRFRGADAKYAKWNHVALVVDNVGTLIEADFDGVHQTTIMKYLRKDYYHVSVNASEEDRNEAVNFAIACLNRGYGYITIASIALALVTGMKFTFGNDGEEICSGLVARSLERTRAIFPKDPSHITPADLAKYFIAS